VGPRLPGLAGRIGRRARGGDVDAEIWIAAGTYKPDRGTGDQTLAFELFGDISLYGGFGGWEECREQRSPESNVTILSGDLYGDDDFNAEPQSDCCDPTLPVGCSDPECRAAVGGYCAEQWDQSCTAWAITVCCDLCRPTRCDNTFNVVRATEPGSSPLLDGLTIRDGEAHDPQDKYAHAGGFYAPVAAPRVTGCQFIRNRGPAAFSSEYHIQQLEKTVFSENGMDFPFSVAVSIRVPPRESVTLRELTVIDNLGFGVEVFDADATIVDCTFRNNGATALNCLLSDCKVVGSEFVGNQGGGIGADRLTRVFDSVFRGNGDNGLYRWSVPAIDAWGPVVVVNSVFAGNTSSSAGAIRCASAYVLNSVFYRNGQGAMSIGDGGATIRNSIFWENYFDDCEECGFHEVAQIYCSCYPTSFLDVDYSIVHGWTGYWGGVGNSGVNPMFVDADGADDIAGTEDDDLRLLLGSPALNAGDPDETYLPAVDLDGHARVLCGRVDMGAYEFGIGDYNCDEAVDLMDFANWESCATGPDGGAYPPGCEGFDFNADGAVDLRDFAKFQAAMPR
jgi:hypothetical protein